MTWVAVAVAGSSLVGGILSSNAQANAAEDAANAQSAAGRAGVAEQQRQFDAIRTLLQPYVNAGVGGFDSQAYLRDNPDVAAFVADPNNVHGIRSAWDHYTRFGQYEGRARPTIGGGSLGAQQDLLGLNGAGAQQSAISGIENGPMFGALAKQGETAILQNASATGGLRGGNVQAALGTFRPQLLASLINDQYSKLGGLTSLSQNAAAGMGNAGMQTGNNVANLMQGIGAAQAGGALGAGAAQTGLYNSIGSAVGTFAGLGGFKGLGGTQIPLGQNNAPGYVNGSTGYGLEF